MAAVLFVCTGNICRSPLAEGIFNHRLRSLGLSGRFRADSAGLIAYHQGEPPDPRTCRTARSFGIDLSAQRSRPFHRRDFAEFDFILAMDRGHFEQLRKSAPPNCREKVRLLLSFLPAGGEVPDPYYGGEQGFHKVHQLVEQGVDALLKHLLERDGAES